MYTILYYSDLDTSGLTVKFNKVVSALSSGDFAFAEARKMGSTGYYRARLDDSNRLLFKPVKHKGSVSLLMLEVIRNHNYQRSRFLRDGEVKEDKIISVEMENDAVDLKASTDSNDKVHLLDKFIIFDEAQGDILSYPLPLIVIGSAGSGKTSVTLEKLKSLSGKILYVSLSSYLVAHTRRVYYANHYENDDQDVSFLSFDEYLQTIEIPKGKEITPQAFMRWFSKHNSHKGVKDGRKLYEEIRGVITGSNAEVGYLSESQYLSLGIKESIYSVELRGLVYQLFQKYLSYMSLEGFYDSNILSTDYMPKVDKSYDAIVVDEVQDFTNSQLSLVLSSLLTAGNFLLCGDANQIVHPNFFSWSKLKSYFYSQNEMSTHQITRILTKNYRNAPEVTELANRVLKLKNYRFGSIDKESHYLVDSASCMQGEVRSVEINAKSLKEINSKTSRSVNYAIIVLHESDKQEARKYFESPLIFTVQEAKGLEYENIILFNMICSDDRYNEIAKGVDLSYLDADFNYARSKDKADKSLEIYKFYVNALYVAITRSVKNVYIIEENPRHRFLELLQVNEIKEVLLSDSKSSVEEWQKEASKLSQQGKEDQANEIEEKILKRKPVPWEVLDHKGFNDLVQKVFNYKTASKRDQIKLLNYAVIYSKFHLIEKLKKIGVKAATNIDKSVGLMEDEYFRQYLYRNNTQLLQQLQTYGVSFRNQFNMTPLMCASYVGNDEKSLDILALEPKIDLVDNSGRTALQIALMRSYQDQKYMKNKLPKIYGLLVDDAISLKLGNHLVKIDRRKGEYFILMQLLVLTKLQNKDSDRNYKISFTAAVLAKKFEDFSDEVLLSYRGRQQYISSMLSKNEEDSGHKYTHRIFKRVKRGHYIVSEGMEVRCDGNWYAFA